MKVWRLPEGGPATRGRPMINLLPLAQGETISTVLPLPEDEAEWGKLHVMFATAKGSVRRNSMDAFTNVPSNGKIAMKFEGEDEDDRLIGVALLDESDDRSEEHTSELQSLMRISYAVFCLKKKKKHTQDQHLRDTNNTKHLKNTDKE